LCHKVTYMEQPLFYYEIKYTIIDFSGEPEQMRYSTVAPDANCAVAKFWSVISMPEDTTSVIIHDVSPISEETFTELAPWTLNKADSQNT